jgi:hypothetical protein
MSAIWLGALLFISGLVLTAAPPIWRGRLSGGRSRPASQSGTLEPPKPGAGFGLKTNWPGLALIVLGTILMLAGAVV